MNRRHFMQLASMLAAAAPVALRSSDNAASSVESLEEAFNTKRPLGDDVVVSLAEDNGIVTMMFHRARDAEFSLEGTLLASVGPSPDVPESGVRAMANWVKARTGKPCTVMG